jgi:hypothetical protein
MFLSGRGLVVGRYVPLGRGLVVGILNIFMGLVVGSYVPFL